MVKSIKMKLQKQTFCMGGVSKIMHHYEAHHPQKSCRNEGRQEGKPDVLRERSTKNQPNQRSKLSTKNSQKPSSINEAMFQKRAFRMGGASVLL